MRYSDDSLNNIKALIAAETGVRFETTGRSRRTGLLLLAAVLTLALATMGVFASRQFEISRNILQRQDEQTTPGGAADAQAAPGGDRDGQSLPGNTNGQNVPGGDTDGPADAEPSSPEDDGTLSGFRISYPFSKNTNEYSCSEYSHKGVDIAAPQGTPVLAAADGTVRVCEYKPDYGCDGILGHEEGYSTVYADMEGFSVEEGQELKVGEQLGTVGSSGLSTGPHLHFELRLDDEPIDPMDHLQE